MVSSQHLISHRWDALMMFETGRLISMWSLAATYRAGQRVIETMVLRLDIIRPSSVSWSDRFHGWSIDSPFLHLFVNPPCTDHSVATCPFQSENWTTSLLSRLSSPPFVDSICDMYIFRRRRYIILQRWSSKIVKVTEFTMWFSRFILIREFNQRHKLKKEKDCKRLFVEVETCNY